MDELERLHTRILQCRACEVAGHIDRAAPVVWGRRGQRMMLVGQAPGVVEMDVRRPFSGRAGGVLFGWLRTVGIGEEEFRDNVYMTAITKCFPGKAKSGAGDRRPSAREIALCRPFLEAQLALVRPEVILLVGGLAIDRYFPRVQLADLIGNSYSRDGVVLIPLPHPSGASRWLNVDENRRLVGQALTYVRAEWERVVSAAPART